MLDRLPLPVVITERVQEQVIPKFGLTGQEAVHSLCAPAAQLFVEIVVANRIGVTKDRNGHARNLAAKLLQVHQFVFCTLTDEGGAEFESRVIQPDTGNR